MKHKVDLSDRNCIDQIINDYGGKDYLQSEFPLLYEAIENSYVYHSKRSGEPKNQEKPGMQDVKTVSIRKNHEAVNGGNELKLLLQLESYFNSVKKKAAVFLRTAVLDQNQVYHGGNSYVFKNVFDFDKFENIGSMTLRGNYDLSSTAEFTVYGFDESKNTIIEERTIVKSDKTVRVTEVEPVIKSTTLLHPINKHPISPQKPKGSPYTSIVYGVRPEEYVSYRYDTVPSPTVIDNKKYAEIYCPFEIEVKLNNKGPADPDYDFTFYKDEPLSFTDLSVSLLPLHPNQYGGGSFSLNNLKAIKTELKENDTVLKITFPDDWKGTLQINEINLAIGEFKFKAEFDVNYITYVAGYPIMDYCTVKASTDVVVTPSSIYVEPVQIKWGCFGKETRFTTETGQAKTASQIRAGDKVLSSQGKFVEVVDIGEGYEEQIVEIKLEERAEILQVTMAHGIMTTRGLIPACDLLFEDEILTDDGTYGGIDYILYKDYNDVIYNIETAEHKMISASGMIVTDKDVPKSARREPEKPSPLPEEFLKELERFTAVNSSQNMR